MVTIKADVAKTAELLSKAALSAASCSNVTSCSDIGVIFRHKSALRPCGSTNRDPRAGRKGEQT